MSDPATPRLSFFRLDNPVVISSAVALCVNVLTATWIAASWHYQIQNQAERLARLEVNTSQQSIVVTETNIRLARIEERLAVALQGNMQYRKPPTGVN